VVARGMGSDATGWMKGVVLVELGPDGLVPDGTCNNVAWFATLEMLPQATVLPAYECKVVHYVMH
jgi:hypothetical protein